MIQNKLNILFYLDKRKVNGKGKCPLRCRLTHLGARKQFATGQFINPKNWNSKQQLVKPTEPDVEHINTQLSLIRTKLNQAFLFLLVNETNFNVEDIFLQYKGKPLRKEFGVIEVYNLHSARIKKLIGIDIKQVTYQKYLESGVHLKGFIKHKFKQKDIQLKAIRSSFLTHYETISKQRKTFSKAP